MSTLKILLITLRADHGGGPKHVDLLINNLSNEFTLFMACPEDKPYYDIWNKNDNLNEIFILKHRKFSFIKLVELYFFIKKHNITLIHSHGKGAGLYSRLLKVFNFKLKIIHTLHGFHIQEYGKVKKFLYINLERIFIYFTNTLINVSKGEQYICKEYDIYNQEKSRVIYNGIMRIEKFNGSKEKLKLENKIVVSMISRFDYSKNMQLAYQIVKKMQNKKNIIFMWIGDGKDKKILEEQAKKDSLNNIYFVGFTKDIEFYLSATDIYLSTSRWEGLPYALIEAQSLGIPIVATDVVGNNEVVDKENGFLFRDEKEACFFIEKLIKNKEKYLIFSKNATKNFNKKFEITNMINQTMKEYRK
jgi:glycosyltransferase involved in cell wall biosynthesis